MKEAASIHGAYNLSISMHSLLIVTEVLRDEGEIPAADVCVDFPFTSLATVSPGTSISPCSAFSTLLQETATERVNEEHRETDTAIKVKPNFASVIPDADLSIQWLATNFLEFYYEQ